MSQVSFPEASSPFHQLGVASEKGVREYFQKLQEHVYKLRADLIARGASDEAERKTKCWDLRNVVLARHGGLLSRVERSWLKEASPGLKPTAGRLFNELRPRLEVDFGLEALEAVVPLRSRRDISETLSPDLTLPGSCRPLGSIHPVTRVQREMEDIFLNLGFAIETGPEVETVYYNFDALNIPESHPSRDDWDTLYIDSQTVLRTHTSPVQIRAMEKCGAPLYIVIPGKCYRNDKPDASHSPMFHQMEGLAVDTDITFADLKGTLEFFAKKFFGETVRTSFRPSFFPFTEPSGEVYVSCAICDGQGCSVCKQSGWIEVMGCGMVHPQVLRNGGIDPDRYSGWAFGLGIDRFAMMKYGIDDIQLFFQSDLRFLEQF
jgi:phenylalanyl-tRNA synthetase alpha chain